MPWYGQRLAAMIEWAKHRPAYWPHVGQPAALLVGLDMEAREAAGRLVVSLMTVLMDGYLYVEGEDVCA